MGDGALASVDENGFVCVVAVDTYAQFADESPVADWSTRLPVGEGRYLLTLTPWFATDTTETPDGFRLSFRPAATRESAPSR